MITKEVYEEQKALSDRWKEMYYEKKQQTDNLNNVIKELEEYFKQHGFWHSLDKIRELKEKYSVSRIS